MTSAGKVNRKMVMMLSKCVEIDKAWGYDLLCDWFLCIAILYVGYQCFLELGLVK